MISMHRFLLLFASLVFITSCVHVPRNTGSTQATASIRAQYLEDNPQGPYNTQIAKGEIVKGMNVIEVLASWGIPDRRHYLNSADSESWTYYSRDPYNDDYVLYELVFDKRMLSRWLMERSTAGVGGGDAALFQQERRAGAPSGDAFRSTAPPTRR